MSRPEGIEFVDDDASRMHYGRDWTRFWTPAPHSIAFPRSTEEVVALVAWARDEGRALVPSGGRTGLSGGAVAADGEVVVAFDRMRDVLELDPAEPSIRVQAGVAVGEVQRRAAEAGFDYPVDWSAADSSQVGGSVATNAGGIRVLRYGMTRDWVRGLTVVTGRGEVLALNRGLIKNNAGLDLRHLMIGSEGILGLITEVTLGLTDAPPERSVLLLAFSGLDAVMPAFQALRAGLSLSAFEFFDAASVQAVAAAGDRTFPLEAIAPFHAVVEFDDPDGSAQDAALAVFEQLVDAGRVVDGLVSQSGSQADELWHWREAISESITPRTPYKNDVSVRVSRVPAFLEALDELVGRQYPDFEVVWFGHIGDGNLHMNVLRPEAWSVEDFREACNRLTPAVFELVGRFGGSLSAEHGVGLLKRDYLASIKSADEIALMRAIKQVFDPDGILNPGKLLTVER
ncbi:FAD-binding oxidoreductase [Wenzhouxiangella sp. XN79A]|uniref:FAD-binding oxidoreductase n=1 Tax=Wenzhouxiangella sp. XN79A TaxID=2724193 RepID=UPI00144AD0A2|nr:FAD-binding oxidoreductase [Wenzhouxiangella sp. XN79A]NKI34693.1 FAD-binding oxidoreductase [Wenzhouxiangella sp. XN79A]